jgi:hypothetical protein
MQRKVVLVISVCVIVIALFMYYRRVSTTETYVLPDFNLVGATSNICPDGYVLVCVSSNLYGISNTIPFPASLPPPCTETTFPSVPICIPHPTKMRPPSEEYRLKSQPV